MPEPIFMKFGTHIMAPDPIKSAYLINLSHQSMCLCILLSLLGNKSVKTFPRQRRIAGGVIIYAVRVVMKESGRLVFPRIP
jgi:hypothetical protein